MSDCVGSFKKPRMEFVTLKQKLRNDSRLKEAFKIIDKYKCELYVSKNCQLLINEGLQGGFIRYDNGDISIMILNQSYSKTVFILLHEIKHLIDAKKGYYKDYYNRTSNEDVEWNLFKKIENRCDQYAINYMHKYFPKVEANKYRMKFL